MSGSVITLIAVCSTGLTAGVLLVRNAHASGPSGGRRIAGGILVGVSLVSFFAGALYAFGGSLT
ncbi:MAG TPA: hypothetical protein VEA19_01090 [Actinomycetota bacterium]|nr:hypothetical protein [Actinomycetota bacterium]